LPETKVDGAKCGKGRVDKTEPLIFSADETCDVGFQAGSPTTTEYGADDNKYSGEVLWVEIDIAVSLDHNSGSSAADPFPSEVGPHCRPLVLASC
jgi:arylsulfatase